MSKYTKGSPFEFEGGTLWRNRLGGIAYMMPVEAERMFKPGENTWLARAHHAFIEAERNEWRWTDDDKTEARKGSWGVHHALMTGRFDVFHDDFPNTTWYDRDKEYPGDGPGNDVADVVRSFLAWHAAQQQPEEPTEFGYVGYVTGEFGVLDILHGDGNRPDLFHVVGRKDGCHFGQRTWVDVLELGTFTPVEAQR